MYLLIPLKVQWKMHLLTPLFCWDVSLWQTDVWTQRPLNESELYDDVAKCAVKAKFADFMPLYKLAFNFNLTLRQTTSKRNRLQRLTANIRYFPLCASPMLLVYILAYCSDATTTDWETTTHDVVSTWVGCIEWCQITKLKEHSKRCSSGAIESICDLVIYENTPGESLQSHR